MKNHTKAIISIIVAIGILIFVVRANRASAPDEVAVTLQPVLNTTPTSTADALTATKTPVVVPVVHKAAPTQTRAFKLVIGQPTVVDGYTFALTNIEDNRCPENVVCVRAGEVRAHIQTEYGSVKKQIVVTFPGAWTTVGDRGMHITKVSPSYPNLNPGAYTVSLEVRR